MSKTAAAPALSLATPPTPNNIDETDRPLVGSLRGASPASSVAAGTRDFDYEGMRLPGLAPAHSPAGIGSKVGSEPSKTMNPGTPIKHHILPEENSISGSAWSRLSAKVERMADEWGQRVESGIKPAVTALTALNFSVKSSSEGRLDGEGNAFLPYVHIAVKDRAFPIIHEGQAQLFNALIATEKLPLAERLRNPLAAGLGPLTAETLEKLDSPGFRQRNLDLWKRVSAAHEESFAPPSPSASGATAYFPPPTAERAEINRTADGYVSAINNLVGEFRATGNSRAEMLRVVPVGGGFILTTQDAGGNIPISPEHLRASKEALTSFADFVREKFGK